MFDGDFDRDADRLSERLDGFADVVRAILEEAAEDPEVARNAPYTTPVRRLDEAGAAKRPVVRWRPG